MSELFSGTAQLALSAFVFDTRPQLGCRGKLALRLGQGFMAARRSPSPLDM